MKQAAIQIKKGLFVPRVVQTSLCSLILVSAFGPVTPALAATQVQANITKIASNGNSVYLEFSVPMVGEDVLTSTGFESGEETPDFYWRGNGNQSIVTNPIGSGRVASLQDTITNSQGNLYDYPDTKAITSRFSLRGRSLPDDALISVQFDALSTKGTNWMQFAAGTGWYDRGFDMMDDHGQNILYAEAVNWNNAPQTFRIKTASGIAYLPDGQVRTVVSSRAQDYTYGLLQYQWSQTNQAFTRVPGQSQPWSVAWPNGQTVTPKVEAFGVGERVLSHNQGAFVFPERTIPSDRTWRTYSMNTQVSQLTYYNLMKYGVFPSMQWKTDGSVYIDNLKFGYAERANIYRDGKQVYSGFESSFTDSEATDQAIPNPVTNLGYSFARNSKHIMANWTPASDIGTEYTYKIQGQLRNGTVGAIQDSKVVAVTSGIKGYIVKLDANPDSQIISGDISTSSTSMAITPASGDRYLHVAAVDQAGNISPTQTSELLDSDAPKLLLSQPDSNPTRSGTVISVHGLDATTWIDSITLPDGKVVRSDTASFIAATNGSYTFKATDYMGNSTQSTIEINNIDITPPTITTPADPAYANSYYAKPFSIPINVSDDYPAKLNVQYYLSPNPDMPDSSVIAWKDVDPNFNVSIDQLGSWWIYVKAQDRAGNQTLERLGSFTYLPLPDAVPVEDIQITSPDPHNLTIKLRERLADVSYRVYINDVFMRRNVFLPGSDTLTISNLTSGTAYSVSVEPYNPSGKASRTIIQATTRPEAARIATILPVEGTENTVTASVYDIHGVDRYVWELYDEQEIKVTTMESQGTTQTFNVIPNAHYSLRVHGLNSAGEGLSGIRNFQALPTLSGLHIVNVETDALQLGWQSVTGDVYYDLYRDDRKDGIRIGAEGTVIGDTYTSVTAATYTPDMIGFNDSGLQSGTEYHYRIAAANAAGYSLWRNVSVWTLPAMPDIRVSEVTDHSLVYDWQPIRGAAAYHVYLNGAYIGRQTGTRVDLSDLEAGADYHLDVLAVNASGTGAAAHITKATLPVQPRFTALLPQEDRVTIQLDNQAADRYEFQYKGRVFQSVAAHASIQVTGLHAGESITGELIAYNSSGASKPLAVTLHTLPNAVTNLRATSSELETRLQWDEVKGAVRYWVETSQGLITVDHNYWTTEAIAPNTLGTYRVWAEGIAGKSLHAAEVSSMGVPLPMMSEPVQVREMSSDGVTLAFNSFQGATAYYIYLNDKLIAETNDTSYRIDHLQSATEYSQYRIRAVNAMSEMSKSYPVSFTTLPANGFTFDVMNKSTRSIDLNVNDVEANAKVIVRLQLSTGEMKEVYSGKAGHIPIDNLSADTSYKIWVHTLSAGGPSTARFIVIRTDQKSSNHLPDITQLIAPHGDSSPAPTVQHTDLLPAKVENRIVFHDIDDRYSKDAVYMLAGKGIIDGYTDGTFRPKSAITRAEFIVMLDKVGLLKDTKSENSFTDISPDDWYADAIKRAAGADIIHGYPDQTFKPNQILSRAEAAKIIGRLPIENNAIHNAKHSFTDDTAIPAWAKDEIASTSYFIGYDNGKFEPNKKITREEVATILYRMFSN